MRASAGASCIFGDPPSRSAPGNTPDSETLLSSTAAFLSIDSSLNAFGINSPITLASLDGRLGLALRVYTCLSQESSRPPIPHRPCFRNERKSLLCHTARPIAHSYRQLSTAHTHSRTHQLPLLTMAAADEQYGNKGYGQIGSYGGNPYDARDQSPAGYNNYDDRRLLLLCSMRLRRPSNTAQAM